MYKHEISMQVMIFPPRITLPQILAQPPGPLNQTVPLLHLLPPSLSLKNWVQGKPVSVST